MKKHQSFLLSSIVVFALSCKKEESRTSNNNNGIPGTCSGGPSTVTDIDGNVYNVVTIGSQCWMKENLKTTKYKNGEVMLSPAGDWSNLTTGAWAYYKDSSQYNNIYGKLYNWYAVTDPRGVCPIGWHVPTDSEWNQLVKYLDPNTDTSSSSGIQSPIAGGLMKDLGDLQSGTGLWFAPNTGAINSSEFTGLPGGYRNFNGSYYLIGTNGFWWSSSEFNTDFARSRNLYYDVAGVGRAGNNKRYGFSVRCVKD